MARYADVNPLEFLHELSDKLMTESITALSRGSMLLNAEGILITDDLENEYISQNNPPVVVETEYAQELSWLLMRLAEGLNDVVTTRGRKNFFQELAETANGLLAKGTDLTGLVQGILARVSMMQAEFLRSQLQAIKNELLASAGALSDLAEQID